MTMLSTADHRQLDELGYLVLPDFVPGAMLEEMRERVEMLWSRKETMPATSFVSSRARVGWPISSTKGTSSRG